MSGDCLNCGHAIGYHHRGDGDEMFCSVLDCACHGYRDEVITAPQRPPSLHPEDI